MNRKWKILLSVCCLVLCMVLTGCNADDPPDTEPGTVSSDSLTALPGDEGVPDEAKPSLPGTEKGALRACVLGESHTLYSGYHFQTDRLFFELKHLDDPSRPESYVLTVTDFATRQQLALCSADGCMHDSAACSAFVEGRASIFEANGQLVLIRRAETVYDESIVEGPAVIERVIPGSITMMDFDGGNPRVLVEAFENFENDWFTDDSYLYGVRVTPAPEGGDPEYDRKRHLFRIHLETAETEDLSELALFECFPIGVLDDKILMRNMSYPKNGRSLEQAEWEENLMAGRYQFLTIDPATGVGQLLEKDLSAWYDNGAYWGDGDFYFTKVQKTEKYPGYTPDLYRLDLRTLDIQTAIAGKENHVYHVEHIFGSKIIFTDTEFTIEDGSLEYVNGDTYYWFDKGTGETQQMRLYYEYEYNLEDMIVSVHDMVVPLADAGDYYLVNSDVLQVNTATSEGSNTAITIYQRSLILKSDFWVGQANYIPITVV